MSVGIGRLVVIKAQPELGVGRVERIVAPKDASAQENEMMRVFFYESGTFATFAENLLAPVPAGAPRHMELFTQKTSADEAEKDDKS